MASFVSVRQDTIVTVNGIEWSVHKSIGLAGDTECVKINGRDFNLIKIIASIGGFSVKGLSRERLSLSFAPGFTRLVAARNASLDQRLKLAATDEEEQPKDTTSKKLFGDVTSSPSSVNSARIRRTSMRKELKHNPEMMDVRVETEHAGVKTLSMAIPARHQENIQVRLSEDDLQTFFEIVADDVQVNDLRGKRSYDSIAKGTYTYTNGRTKYVYAIDDQKVRKRVDNDASEEEGGEAASAHDSDGSADEFAEAD
jgi:hypothetical protein